MRMPDWLTLDQAAAYLKVSQPTIYRWCAEGILVFYELESGGGRRFKLEDLDGLLRNGSYDLKADPSHNMAHLVAIGQSMSLCQKKAAHQLSTPATLPGLAWCGVCKSNAPADVVDYYARRGLPR